MYECDVWSDKVTVLIVTLIFQNIYNIMIIENENKYW